jgi:hypothetical protein
MSCQSIQEKTDVDVEYIIWRTRPDIGLFRHRRRRRRRGRRRRRRKRKRGREGRDAFNGRNVYA